MTLGAERENATLSMVEQLEQLMAALSLNKILLAGILRVSRSNIDEWFAGKQPKGADEKRVLGLLNILVRGSVSATNPLNARFVRWSWLANQPSLVELLSHERTDAQRILAAIGQARVLTEDAERRRGEREQRLRELGFEDHSKMRRRATLARNMALLDWPED